MPELSRKRRGKRTRTGMSEESLRHFAKKRGRKRGRLRRSVR